MRKRMQTQAAERTRPGTFDCIYTLGRVQYSTSQGSSVKKDLVLRDDERRWAFLTCQGSDSSSPRPIHQGLKLVQARVHCKIGGWLQEQAAFLSILNTDRGNHQIWFCRKTSLSWSTFFWRRSRAPFVCLQLLLLLADCLLDLGLLGTCWLLAVQPSHCRQRRNLFKDLVEEYFLNSCGRP